MRVPSSFKIGRTDWLFIGLLMGYLAFSLGYLSDYGMLYDSFKNFKEGEANLRFFFRSVPANDRANYIFAFQIHGSLFFMLFEWANQILNQQLHWMNFVDAHHVLLPILTGGGLGVFYLFLRRERSALLALIAIAFMITSPRFYGSTMNHVKDGPLFIFFLLALCYAYSFVSRGSVRWDFFYKAFLCFAIALATKLYALFVPLIFGAWFLLVRGRCERSEKQQRWTVPPALGRHLICGVLLTVVIFFLFYMPGFYGVSNKAMMLALKYNKIVAPNVGVYVTQWSLYPFQQIIATTPVFFLLAFALGILWMIWKQTRTAWDYFLLVWLGIILFFPCLPFVKFYDGTRLFIAFFAPFSIIAAEGVLGVSEWGCARWHRLRKIPVAVFLVTLVTVSQVRADIETHPFQSLYFNGWVGGMQGARARGVPYAFDYTAASIQMSAQWLNNHLPVNAVLYATSPQHDFMLNAYGLRKDIQHRVMKSNALVAGSYLWIPYFPEDMLMFDHGGVRATEIRKALERYRVMQEFKSQGSVIGQVYYIY